MLTTRWWLTLALAWAALAVAPGLSEPIKVAGVAGCAALVLWAPADWTWSGRYWSLLAVVTAALAQVRADVGLPTDLLVFTLVVATVAVIGGFQPAALAAVMSFLAVNWYFTPPLHTWTIGDPENLVALFAFLARDDLQNHLRQMRPILARD